MLFKHKKDRGVEINQEKQKIIEEIENINQLLKLYFFKGFEKDMLEKRRFTLREKLKYMEGY